MTRERLDRSGSARGDLRDPGDPSDQPIVENYVGRQIPTAMVARNLERGTGFLRPQLDTGPFPNLFLVEPPIYAQVVGGRPADPRVRLEPTGRLVSAAGDGAGGLGPVRPGPAPRRAGRGVPGGGFVRAVPGHDPLRPGVPARRPDARVRPGRACGAGTSSRRAAIGDGRPSVGSSWRSGLALKVTVGLGLDPVRPDLSGAGRSAGELAAGGGDAGSGLAWYLHAWARACAIESGGSLASADNAGIWLRSLSPASLASSCHSTRAPGRGLVIRSFTPVGFVLAIVGLAGFAGRSTGSGGAGRSARAGDPRFGGEVAPRLLLDGGRPAGGGRRGLGAGRALAESGRSRAGLAAVILGSSLLGLCLVQSASTWRTPPEWAAWPRRPARSPAIAPARTNWSSPPRPSSIRPTGAGCRLEFEPAGRARAAGEWGVDLEIDDGRRSP